MRPLTARLSALFVILCTVSSYAYPIQRCSTQLGHFDVQTMSWALSDADRQVKVIFDQAAPLDGPDFQRFVGQVAALAFVDASLASAESVSMRVRQLDSDPELVALFCDHFNDRPKAKDGTKTFIALLHATAAAFLNERALADVSSTGSPIVIKAVATQIVATEIDNWREGAPDTQWVVSLAENASGLSEIVFSSPHLPSLDYLRGRLGRAIRGIGLRYTELTR